MTENKGEDAVQRSGEIPTTPCEVSKRDENTPVAAGDGLDPTEELTWARRHVQKEPAENSVGLPVPEDPAQAPMNQTAENPVQQPAGQPAPKSPANGAVKDILQDLAQEPLKEITPGNTDQQTAKQPAPESPARQLMEQVVPENPFRETVKKRPVNPAQRPAEQATPKSPAPEPAKQTGPVPPAQKPLRQSIPVSPDRKPAKQAPEAVSTTMGENPSAETVQEVFRKTELHTAPPVAEEDTELKTLRKKMILKLKRPKCEVSYLSYETAFREFIASLMVRQDKTDAALRPQIAALWDQVRVLEERLDRRTARLDQRIVELADRERY